MWDWLNSPAFLILVAILAWAALYRWGRRRPKKKSAGSWEVFHAACGTSTTRGSEAGSQEKTSKTPEAEWTAALKYDWRPGLKLSRAEKIVRV